METNAIHSLQNGTEETSEKKKRVKEYNRKKIVLSIIELVVSLSLILVIIVSGVSGRLEVLALGVSNHPYIAFLVFVALLGVIELIMLFPLEFYEGYVLEHQYELSNQTFFRWLWEELKGLLIGVVLFTPVLLIFYFFLRNLQQLWWLPIAGVLFLFGVLLARLGPVLIFPLFYKFEPIANEELVHRLKKLAEPLAVNISGIFRFNLSKNTKKANAAFAGLGKTKRIIIGDTLLDNFDNDEIASVFAHELGHYRHGHIWKGIVTGFLTSFMGLYVTAMIYEKCLGVFGFSAVDQLAALPLLGFLFSIYGLLVMPLQNTISRYFERQADFFVFKERDNIKPFISSMERLAEMNLADKEPHPLVEFWFYGHPSVKKRIEAARQFNKS